MTEATIGKGTKAGKELSSLVSEIEHVRERKKQIGDQEKEIFATAKAKGYDPATIRRIIKFRADDNQKREQAEALFDSYLHAIGMEKDLPLFRSVGLMGVDVSVGEQVIEALSLLVPTTGEFIVKVGAARVRLFRDAEGIPHVEEYTDIIAPRDARFSPGEGPLSEPTSTYPPSGRARGLSKDAIRAAVERAEASAAEKRAGVA
jgi:uncharacterized protein (UPF0335 family)